jgi:UDP-N-acetylglucosamine 2-epimerase (non-hydrolysing)
MKVIHVVGARPNFMKIAPIIEAVRTHNSICRESDRIEQVLVHTGQHYDERMSKSFFDDLEIPKPDVNLEVGSSSHAEQTAEIMKKFEKVCLAEKPTHVLVVGDVNSTIACALVASKLGIKVIHVEAGLRSFDRGMPEEINRVLTDVISDFLFITEKSALENLHREGIAEDKIHFVGNVMIDSLLKHRKKAEQSDILRRLGLANHKNNGPDSTPDFAKSISVDDPQSPAIPYAVLTLHRPSNVDNKDIFRGIVEAVRTISEKLPVVFPAHPRTLGHIKDFGLSDHFNWSFYDSKAAVDPLKSINLISPLGYLDFLHLMANARLMLTDSGGIQEETTILGIPCITLRENTERPVTVSLGTNIIAGTEKDKIISLAMDQLSRKPGTPPVPAFWDGKAATRIVNILSEHGLNAA